MSRLLVHIRRSTLPVLIMLCLAALSVSYAFASDAARPLATQVIGDPDAAVTGKLAVGTATPGNKALTVVGVIDFLGAGTVHNYFTQGAGNNMQINTNVDEANTVGDASRSQWKMVLGSNLDQFSIRRSPASGTYNEDALFFIDGPTGNVGIATVDTGNGASIPFTPAARLHALTASGNGIMGVTIDTTGAYSGVYGLSVSTSGIGVYGGATATAGFNYGTYGRSYSTDGVGVYGYASATSGYATGVFGQSVSTVGNGVAGWATATSGSAYGVYGASFSPSGRGVYGLAASATGVNYGVYGYTASTSGYGVYFVGGLAGTGTKSAIVDTKDYGWRTLYAVESPQNWFEDFGQTTLDSGETVVPIESIFAQTINLKKPYHVFLTPLGSGCTLYVADKSSTTFTVRANEGASCEIAFDYRIIAPRLDYEDQRLKPAQDPKSVEASAAQHSPALQAPPPAPPSTP
jgi:hypothetical protein